MTPEQKRIAIAEACGWTFKTIGNRLFAYKPETKVGHAPFYDEIPDYLNDLNAMASVFEMIRLRDSALYWQLHKKLDGLVAIANSRDDCKLQNSIATADATAAQRADAFLAVLNLLQD
jgi:hypothetical protein